MATHPSTRPQIPNASQQPISTPGIRQATPGQSRRWQHPGRPARTFAASAVSVHRPGDADRQPTGLYWLIG
jgi:hypothetical protein